jgi:hypothetical protein
MSIVPAAETIGNIQEQSLGYEGLEGKCGIKTFQTVGAGKEEPSESGTDCEYRHGYVSLER